MMQFSRIVTALCAAGTLALLTSTAATAAGPATVSLEVTGGTAPLVVQTPVTTTTAPVVKDGVTADSCTGTSAAGALETGTAGDWTGPWYGGSLGYGVATIKGETHNFGSGAYWSFYVNGKAADNGVCGTELSAGDRVQFTALCEYPNTTDCFAGEPLQLTAPKTVTPGVPFQVSVTETNTTYGGAPDYITTSTSTPSSGVSIAGATTAADGTATVTLPAGGVKVLTAIKADRPPATAQVCATTGIDGLCSSPNVIVPANAKAPTVGGSAVAGATLTCGVGTWTGTAPVFAYQWLQDGEAIAGATASTYVVRSGDADHTLACRVQGTNAAGGSSATSATVAVVTPVVVKLSTKQLEKGFALTRKGSASLTLQCIARGGPCRAGGTVTVAGAAGRTLAKLTTTTIQRGASGPLKFALSKKTLKSLQKKGKVRTVRITVRVRTTADGRVVAINRHTTLRIPATP